MSPGTNEPIFLLYQDEDGRAEIAKEHVGGQAIWRELENGVNARAFRSEQVEISIIVILSHGCPKSMVFACWENVKATMSVGSERRLTLNTTSYNTD